MEHHALLLITRRALPNEGLCRVAGDPVVILARGGTAQVGGLGGQVAGLGGQVLLQVSRAHQPLHFAVVLIRLEVFRGQVAAVVTSGSCWSWLGLTALLLVMRPKVLLLDLLLLEVLVSGVGALLLVLLLRVLL